MSIDSGKRPEVCVFTSAHNASSSRVVHREAVSLASAGYDVTFYGPRGEVEYDDIDTVNYASIPDGDIPGMGKRLKLSGQAARALAGTDFDVYHFHDAELLPVGAQLSVTTDAAVIYDVHENVPDVLATKDFVHQSVRGPFASVANVSELGLARLVDALVVASPDIGERFDGFDEVTTVTNYPMRKWAEGTDMDAKAERAADGETTVAYCGLLSEQRGILGLIEAVDRVPDKHDVSLVLGGTCESDAFEERLTDRVAQTDHVELRGWLPTLEDVIDMFRDADIGVYTFYSDPNKTEAVHRSNKLFQYMAAGLPVVVSDIGDWRTMVDDVECGVTVDPEDPDAVAAALANMAADADRRVEFGRNGHEAALERYNWDTQRERLLDLYGRLT